MCLVKTMLKDVRKHRQGVDFFHNDHIHTGWDDKRIQHNRRSTNEFSHHSKFRHRYTEEQNGKHVTRSQKVNASSQKKPTSLYLCILIYQNLFKLDRSYSV